MSPLLRKLRACEHIDSADLEWRWLQEKFHTEDELSAAVDRRLQGEPLAYILGEWEFYGIPFAVNPDVLIPRPETELLVDLALSWMSNHKQEANVLDLGTGSGCIGLSVLQKNPKAKLTAVDFSEAALAVAMHNCGKLNLQSRTELLLADASSFLSEKKFDLVLANPPYIAFDDPNTDALALSYEPRSALYTDRNGLACIQTWIKVAVQSLDKLGLVAFEIGHMQGQEAKRIFTEAGAFDQVEIRKDLAGLDRVVVGMRGV